MRVAARSFAVVMVVCFVFLLGSVPSHAQGATAMLSGTVRGPSAAIPAATVTTKNVATGRSTTVRTGADGRYTVPDLAPGAYEVSIAAHGFSSQAKTVTLEPGKAQTLNFQLAAALSLQSLGFSPAQIRGSATEQYLLNKRSHMLQVHQKLGLITAIPMVASLIAATQAGGRHSSPTGRDVHMALGSATAGLYFATAYYAIFAPKVPGVKSHGPIRFHKAMAWIHFPGMVLTPILGAMAESQRNQGERVHGIAKYHGEVAVITAAAYGLALLSETKPSWIPGLEHHALALVTFHHHGRTEEASKNPNAPVAESGLAFSRNGD